MPRFRNHASADDHVLRVYVASHCAVCRESLRLVRRIAVRLPTIPIEVIYIDGQEPVDEIFAVPTYCYGKTVVSLGNPREEELIPRVMELDRRRRSSASPEGHAEARSQPAEKSAVRSHDPRTVSRVALLRGPVTTCCGAAGIAGALLCSLTMAVAPAGMVAMHAMGPSTGGMSGSLPAGQSPGVFAVVAALNPEILAVSVLLVALAVAPRHHLATLPAVAGGLVLFVAMYGQSSLPVMRAGTALGIALLLLGYLFSLRSRLWLPGTRPG